METVHGPYRHERPNTPWKATVGLACALALAILTGVCSPLARPLERVEGRESSLSANLPGRQDRLVGVHDVSLQGQLELPRPISKPPPAHKRLDFRHDLALRPEAGFTARLRARVVSSLLFIRHGRVADRPVVANCPAQGPPRTV